MADTGWCFGVLTSFVVFLVALPSTAWSKSYQCPAACTCLGPLVDCSKRSLSAIPDDLPAWVEILDLSSNKIKVIAPLVAQGLSKLEDLDLSNNLIRELNQTVFAELPALKVLKLNYNGLSEVPLLPGAAAITSLSLQHNEISVIDPQALNLLPKLRHLALGHNRLKDLAADMFPLHPTLHQLYLNNNRLKTIEQGALRNLPSLTWLKLNKNKIKHLPKEVFVNLTKLQDLELSRNRLQSIEGLTFKGLTSLVTLKLDRNAISDLKDGAFYGPGNVQNLILDHNNITVVTKGWLYGLTRLEVLSLPHNRVSHVENEVWTYCELLSKLDLRNNELSLVTENTFASLGSLQHLVVTNNHMSYIAQGAFSDLSSLQVLELDNNEISWTIEDMNAAFSGLIGLKRLSLRNNNIQLIAKRAFEGLDHLQVLNLENNSLTSIQMNAFGSMVSLQELYINSSSLVCDCQLAWLPHWLGQVGFQNTVTAKCIHPAGLQGTSVMDIAPEQFKCDDSPKPVIQVQPESQAALKGSNTSLECVAVSSDPSTITVQWRKDNILLQKGNVETYERSPDEGILEVRSVLVFQNLDDQHGGIYQCVVSNKLGTAYSAKAEITVNIMPYFMKTPEDVTSPIGTTAKLECKATGHPAPRIAWKKDGGDNFPAARERRLLMMPTDDVFFITKVNLEDEGVYSCTAENNVGTIIANATLKVLKKPVFEHQMEDKVVEQGTTAVLECMASGNPKPNVEWLKDDQPLEITDRHFFTAEKRLLVIYKTEKLDAGVYTCHVQNALAKEEGQSRLTVTPVDIDSWKYNPDTEVLDPEAEPAKSGMFGDDSMMTGIIIIAVVCCVVGTSLIWVIIIYKTRKRTEEYSSTPTDETTLPGDMPSTPFQCSDSDRTSPAALAVAAQRSAKFAGYNGMEANGYAGMQVNGGFRYSPAKGRMAAIFPSDIEDDHLRQSIPLTSDEQQLAESSDTSITMLRRLRHSTGGSESTPSPQHSSYSLQSSRSNVLQTFQPHLAASQAPCPQHSVPVPTCDECLHGTAVAVIHTPSAVVHPGSCPRLDTIISEDEREPRSSGDDQDVNSGRAYDGHYGSQPPGQYSDESDYSCATFPTAHGRQMFSSPHQSLGHHGSNGGSTSEQSCLASPQTPNQIDSNQPASGKSCTISDTNCEPVTGPCGQTPSVSVPSSRHTMPTSSPHNKPTNGHVQVAWTVKLPQSVDSHTDSESCHEDLEDYTRGHGSSSPPVSTIPSWHVAPSYTSYAPGASSDTTPARTAIDS